MGRFARRLLAVVSAATLGGITLGAGAAWADSGDVDQLTITSDGVTEPLVLRAAEAPRLTAAVHAEVGWLVGRSGNSDALDDEHLGPGYQLEVHLDGEARQRFLLYPLAQGGPRVHRPAEQPGDRTTDEAWFYGRVSMPDTLAAAGVDVPGAQPRLPGGGGGGGDMPETGSPDAAPDRGGLVRTWLEGMQLTALIAVGIATGLAAVALLIRRKV